MITGANYQMEADGSRACLGKWRTNAEMGFPACNAHESKALLSLGAHRLLATHWISFPTMVKVLATGLALWTCVASARSIARHNNDCATLQHGLNYVVESNLVQPGRLNITGAELPATNNIAFCRVIGQIPYGANNTINFEVWLPTASDYNDRYLSVGRSDSLSNRLCFFVDV